MSRTNIFPLFLILIIGIALIMGSNLILSNERIRPTNTYNTELKYTRVNETYNQKRYKNDDQFVFDIKMRNYYLKEHDLDPCLMEQLEFHIVQSGETLWSIAHKHDINIDTLIGANNIDNMNRIKPGDSLLILPTKGILYKIGPGQSIERLAENFGISADNVRNSNNIASHEEVQPGRLVLLPGAKPEFGYQDRLEKMLIAPVNARISSYYGRRWGRMHEGVDYAINIGTPIRAAGAGRVVYSGWASGYGKAVIIEHRKGLRTLYAHNSRLLVHVGEYVERNEVIAKSGNTGNSTGPHLHFEVQINSRAVNPLNYLR